MPSDCFLALSPIISLLINVFVQVFSFRYFAKIGLLKSIFLGFIAGFLSTFLLGAHFFLNISLSLKEVIGIFICNMLTYSLLGYCYFHFINLGETARRIRILRELYDTKDGLSMEEILERYNCQELVNKRINRLLYNGQIVFKNGRYYIGNPAMLLISKIIITCKLIVMGTRSEFY